MFIYHYNLFTLVLKSPDGEWPITYTFTFTFNHEGTTGTGGTGSSAIEKKAGAG